MNYITKEVLVKILRYILLTFGLALFLWACANSSESVTPFPIQTEAAAETGSPVASPTGSGPDECLACHVDKQRLIDTAKPVVAAESESKGVG